MSAVRLALGVAASASMLLFSALPAEAGVFGSVGEFGERGGGDAQFDNPQQIAVDQVSGRIYVLDRRGAFGGVSGYFKVKKFNPDGTPVEPAQTITLVETTAIIPFTVSDIAVDGQAGMVYLAVQSRNAFDSRGNPGEVWQIPVGASGTVVPKKYVLDNGTPANPLLDPTLDPATADDLNSAGALAVDTVGNRVYVGGAGSQEATVWRIAPSAGGSGSVSTAPVSSATLTAVKNASALAFAQSKLHVLGEADTGGLARIITLTSALGATAESPMNATASTGTRPFGTSGLGSGLAVEPSGAVLVSDGHDFDGGGGNSSFFGLMRFTSLSSATPEKYWGNANGTEICQFTRPSDFVLNQVSGEILATDGLVQISRPASSGVRRIQRFAAGGSGCGFEPAKADFTVSSNPTSSQPTTLDASTSLLPTSKPAFSGTFTTYRWDLDNNPLTGPSGFEVSNTTPTVVQTFPKGNRTVRLQVEVTGGETSVPFTKSFQVKGPSPTAAFTVSPAGPKVNETVTFDASSSTPAADGSAITTYRWDFNGDGTFDTGASASPRATTTYTAARSYRVRVEVADTGGETDTEDKTVTVAAATVAPTPVFPQSPPPPADLVAPKITLGQTAITATARGVVGLGLSCPGNETSCAFDVTLRTAKPVRDGKRKRILVLGRATVLVSGGKSGVASVKLSRAGAAVLRKSKRLRAAAVIVVRDAAQNTATQTVTVTLRAAGKRR